MYKYILNKISSILLILIVVSCSSSDESNDETPDAILPFFTDDFETGDHSSSENGFKWSSNNVTIADTPNSTKGLKYTYGPNTINEDSWQEQRFHLGGDYGDFWVKYDLYIPQNFHHRCPVKLKIESSDPDVRVGDTIIKVKNDTGSYSIPNQENWGVVKHIAQDTIMVDQLPDYLTFLDGNEFKNKRNGTISKVAKRLGYGNNNKFFLVWQGDYGSDKSGNSISFENWYKNRGNSCLSYYPAKDHGAWRAGHTISENYMIDKKHDLGKWMEVIFHIKVASSSNDDGIIQVWKNGQQYLNVTDLPNYSEMGFNYFQYGYLLGWSNSGFDEETILYIDNVVFSTGKITSSVQ
ncbi:heparin lyase I family protein [Aquimarina aquimarini]|uniref:heparin lyase I family protein n=1 Tax=Aquimarina aquimarini TaxID=1191734 RepID=UPI000D55BEF9|nr:heparin lyase I family protein [Aquimarina aquimarini]